MLPCVALLLLGCLSCTEAGEDIVGELLSQPDIHAVLRNMTAQMTEQRNQLQETMDKLNEQQVDMLQSKQALQAALGKLSGCDCLIKDKKVAFSASLHASGRYNTGPYNVDTILTYSHIFTNVGNAYNPHSGFFTAPVAGVYQFSFFVYGYGGNTPTSAVLFKNSQLIMVAYEHQPGHTYSASNGAILQLAVGDVVCVKLRANTWIHDNEHHPSTFSGHLLFTM